MQDVSTHSPGLVPRQSREHSKDGEVDLAGTGHLCWRDHLLVASIGERVIMSKSWDAEVEVVYCSELRSAPSESVESNSPTPSLRSNHRRLTFPLWLCCAANILDLLHRDLQSVEEWKTLSLVGDNGDVRGSCITSILHPCA